MSTLYAYPYDDWNWGCPEIPDSTFQTLLVDRTDFPSSPVHCAIRSCRRLHLIDPIDAALLQFKS